MQLITRPRGRHVKKPPLFRHVSVIHHRFRHMVDEDEEEVHIDPKEHQPDEEHTNEEAKNRKKRFQDEWE